MKCANCKYAKEKDYGFLCYYYCKLMKMTVPEEYAKIDNRCGLIDEKTFELSKEGKIFLMEEKL